MLGGLITADEEFGLAAWEEWSVRSAFWAWSDFGQFGLAKLGDDVLQVLNAQLVTVQNTVSDYFETSPCVPAQATAAAQSIATSVASAWASSVQRVRF